MPGGGSRKMPLAHEASFFAFRELGLESLGFWVLGFKGFGL